MKIPPIAFTRTFLAEARKAAPQADLPADTLQVSTGMLARWFSKPPTEQQARVALQAACAAVGAPLAAVIAQQAGASYVDDAAEKSIGEAHAAKFAQSAGLSGLWDRVSKHAQRRMECKVVDDGNFGPAMFSGSTVLLDSRVMGSMPQELQIFLTAHEMAHVEHRDCGRKTGLSTLAVLEPRLALNPNAASIEMEFAADRRAAEVAAREGCSPAPILKQLLCWPGGETHPEPLERASAVREAMALHGKSISDADFDALVAETAAEREKAMTASREARELKNAFQDLV